MNQTATATRLDIKQSELAQKISSMNLEPVIFKLVHECDWTLEKALLVEAQYKTFLLMALTLSTPTVPTKEIDEMWHNHILDTSLYAFHCKEVFGRFLDHFPYLGVRGGNDAQLLKDSFKVTVQQFAEFAPIFGANLIKLHGTESSLCVGQCAEHGCNSPSPSCCDGDIQANTKSALCNSGPCNGNSCETCGGGEFQQSGLGLYGIRPNIAMLG